MTHDYDEPPADDFGQPAAPQLPPFDVAAEKAVLGAMILSSRAIAEVVEILERADFSRRANGKAYRCRQDPSHSCKRPGPNRRRDHAGKSAGGPAGRYASGPVPA